MNKFVVAGMLMMVSMSAMAMKPCDELKGEIAAKMDAKGVQNYRLEIVANEEVGDQKVVGSCEAGTKSIVYTRGGGTKANAAAPKSEAKPGL